MRTAEAYVKLLNTVSEVGGTPAIYRINAEEGVGEAAEAVDFEHVHVKAVEALCAYDEMEADTLIEECLPEGSRTTKRLLTALRDAASCAQAEASPKLLAALMVIFDAACIHMVDVLAHDAPSMAETAIGE